MSSSACYHLPDMLLQWTCGQVGCSSYVNLSGKHEYNIKEYTPKQTA